MHSFPHKGMQWMGGEAIIWHSSPEGAGGGGVAREKGSNKWGVGHDTGSTKAASGLPTVGIKPRAGQKQPRDRLGLNPRSWPPEVRD